MALIRCPDCGTEISDAAPACLKCGRPIASSAAPPFTVPLQRHRESPRSRNILGAFVLITFVCLGFWIYFQAQQPESADPRQAALTAPTAAPAAHAGGSSAPLAVTTPSQLYSDYASNEVATDQRLAGKIIQVTAPVQSIDKDFTDSAVLRFATGDEFGSMSAVMDDSQKGLAAVLSRGQVVTIQCKAVRRVLDSPVGSDCTFAEERAPMAAATGSALKSDQKQKLDAIFQKMAHAAGEQADTDYAAAIQAAIVPNWVHQDNLPMAPCEVHITQLPGGSVVSAVVDDSCPYDAAGRISVENAVLRSQPLPYKGFERVFRRNLTMTFSAQ